MEAISRPDSRLRWHRRSAEDSAWLAFTLLRCALARDEASAIRAATRQVAAPSFANRCMSKHSCSSTRARGRTSRVRFGWQRRRVRTRMATASRVNGRRESRRRARELARAISRRLRRRPQLRAALARHRAITASPRSMQPHYRRPHDRDPSARADAATAIISRTGRGWQYWVVNPRGARCTIISVNGDDEFLMFSKAAERRRAADRRRRWPRAMRRAVGADIAGRGASAIGPGPRASRWWPSASAPAAWCSPAMPCICSRRPAASA